MVKQFKTAFLLYFVGYTQLSALNEQEEALKHEFCIGALGLGPRIGTPLFFNHFTDTVMDVLTGKAAKL